MPCGKDHELQFGLIASRDEVESVQVMQWIETVACLRREKVDGYIEIDYNVDK